MQRVDVIYVYLLGKGVSATVTRRNVLRGAVYPTIRESVGKIAVLGFKTGTDYIPQGIRTRAVVSECNQWVYDGSSVRAVGKQGRGLGMNRGGFPRSIITTGQGADLQTSIVGAGHFVGIQRT